MNKANEICKPIKTIVTKDLLILLRKILRVVSIRNILLRKNLWIKRARWRLSKYFSIKKIPIYIYEDP
jgi:hypothetical protein